MLSNNLLFYSSIFFIQSKKLSDSNNSKYFYYLCGMYTKDISMWLYIYLHTDRLSSGSAVTDGMGRAVHVLGYMSYGETLLDLSQGGYETPCQFTCYEKDQETGLHYAEARYYDSRLSIFNSTDPMWYKYPHLSPYAYCEDNPLIFVDPDGRFPIWAFISACLDYGFQVYDNYKSGISGYDAWVGDVDLLDVGLSAVKPTGKFKIAKTLLVEGTKAVINITAHKGIVKSSDDAQDIITKTVVNTVVDVGVRKVTDAGSKKAVQNANKEVSTAHQKLKTAERQAQRSPNSTKKAENVNNAQSNLQSARNKQVRTQMLNSTVGKATNATQQGARIITNIILKDE